MKPSCEIVDKATTFDEEIAMLTLRNPFAIVGMMLLSFLAAGCASVKNESADEILAKAAKAADPNEVMKNIKTMVLTSKVVAPNGFPGRLVIRMKFPDMIRIEVRSAEETYIVAYNGKKAWEYGTKSGYHELRGKELEDVRFQAAFYVAPSTNFKDIFSKVVLKGVEEVNGFGCHILVAQPLPVYGIPPITLYVDKETYMVVKSVVTHNTRGGPVVSTTYFNSYEDVDGVMMPMNIISEAAGDLMELNNESVAWNEEIDQSYFDPPRELRKK